MIGNKRNLFRLPRLSSKFRMKKSKFGKLPLFRLFTDDFFFVRKSSGKSVKRFAESRSADKSPSESAARTRLTPDQMKAIRRLNAEKKADVQEAQRKAAEARRNLDIAIYSDNADDAEVKMRLEEFQNAQTEVIKIRATVEYEIRKILTPEQVVRFRQLRQRFAQVRENVQERRQNNLQNQRTIPQNRFNNRQRINPKN
ncbi:periplasmic heavy metal sensor [Biomphalaria pfeifferi]|uniref:Periplasmic heavy metal sensor n=1 Tax=Biomphalaria pfeifferi TaxID=112525 RepID=A0AAD8AN91_BIOPF|nr:periplasmic heavy metal sensor [Biomphalaria pfeifferi]